MVGGMDGGEAPEWSEETAYGALANLVFWHFTSWSDDGQELLPTRRIRTPSEVFAAAAAMLAGAA